GRPPPKLRYFGTDTTRSQNERIKSVVRNIEEYFDEFDSSSDTEDDLSPLCKRRTQEWKEEDPQHPAQLKPDPVIELVLETSECPPSQKESGFMRTSSPIDEESERGDQGAEDDGDHRASPLLLDDDRFNDPQGMRQPDQKIKSLEKGQTKKAKALQLKAKQKWQEEQEKQPVARKKSKSGKTQDFVEQTPAPCAEEDLGLTEKARISRQKKASAGSKRNATKRGLSIRSNVELTQAPSQKQHTQDKPHDDGPHPHYMSIGQSSPGHEQYIPAPANQKHRNCMTEQSNGHSHPKSEEEKGPKETGYDDNEDVGKRRRRKPGSWWLINQDNDQVDSNMDDNNKKLYGSKRKKFNRIQELAEPNMNKSSKTELNSRTNKKNLKSRELVLKSPKIKGPSKVPGQLEQQEEQGHDRARGHEATNVRSERSIMQLKPSSGIPRKSGCSMAQHVPCSCPDSDNSGKRQRHPPGNWWEVPKLQVFDNMGSPKHLEGSMLNAFATKPQSSREAGVCSREPLLKNPKKWLMVKNAKTAMKYFGTIFTPGDAEDTGLSCHKECLSKSMLGQPPLSPVVLEVEDRADLVVWLKNVLSTS
ncbi:hypothetical protein Z043_114716, partial [Scleropages formosus]